MTTLCNLVVDTSAIDSALAEFRHAYPAYDATSPLDELRAKEYGRLDLLGQTYLDYTGGGLYAESQLRQHIDFLIHGVFGNPHSANLPSLEMTERVEQARECVLEFFNASPEEYEVIFTQNATGALKLIGESYPFGSGSRYLLTSDNHNSVNGIREIAKAKGAHVEYVPIRSSDLRVDHDLLIRRLSSRASGRRHVVSRMGHGRLCGRNRGNKLFAYPAQSNFSGVQHSLDWVTEAQASGWDVLVDCAAFAPTNQLDLGRWHPDFASLSFYKIFGYPTGIGCLIARKSALAKLRRPWFAGGTVMCSSVKAADVPGAGFLRTPGPAGYEDGTVNYLAIPAIDIGLRHIASVGMGMIHTRVTCLTSWLLERLVGLRHGNGAPMIRIYGPLDTRMRGGTIAMNFFDPAGQLIDSRLVEREANRVKLSLRSGCHCNPGARETALALSRNELVECALSSDHLSDEDFLHVVDEKTTGAARVSIGLATTFADVYRFYEFAAGFRDVPLDDEVGPIR
ncbi:MAG: aminotransferase class V-fold PLP-dependent enzyme [Egibacteraceae bacterium]